MKKFLTVMFSLLLVFLIIPVLPTAAYADGGMTADEAVANALAAAESFPDQPYDRTVKNTALEAEQAQEGPMRAPGMANYKTVIDDYVAGAFVDGTLPVSGWESVDMDGDGWGWLSAKEVADGFTSLDGEDSDCITSASYVNNVGALEPDNWLISPSFRVPEGKQLHFYVTGQDSGDFAEHYEVLISAGSPYGVGNDPSIVALRFTKLYEDTVNTSREYVLKTVDLSQFEGQNVRIAFRHCDCTDQFWLNLDGVGLSDVGTVPEIPHNELGRANIIRVYGQTRYDTSIEIAKQMLWKAGKDEFPNAIIATGDNFADALAGSAVSTRIYAPIILVSNNVPSSFDNALDFIKSHVSKSGTVLILGGEGAVQGGLEGRLNDAGYKYYRFAGKDRYETNLKVLAAFNLQAEDNLLVCDGTNWPDAATASASGFPIMLAAKTGLNDAQTLFLEGIKTEEGEQGKLNIAIVGGEGAVPKPIEDQLEFYATEDGVGRFAGSNRAETAAMLADWMYKNYYEYYPTGATFAYGRNYPDCISGGLLAWYTDCPILYADSAAPASYVAADEPFVSNYDITFAYILGGKGLVASDLVANMLEANLAVD